MRIALNTIALITTIIVVIRGIVEPIELEIAHVSTYAFYVHLSHFFVESDLVAKGVRVLGCGPLVESEIRRPLSNSKQPGRWLFEHILLLLCNHLASFRLCI